MTMQSYYQLLDWDTTILGIPTAKLLPEHCDAITLQTVLEELKSKDIKLVYWASDSEDKASQQAAKQCKGFLADHKVTYWMDLTTATLPEIESSPFESYQEQHPTEELFQLAIEVGLRSRFKKDSKFTFEQLSKVYKTWMENSVNRSIAKEVLVLKKNNKIIAMVTLGEKNKCGDIGLISVDANYRGHHLATALVRASQQWSVQNNYSCVQVVTQQDNIPACHLYEKCGYHVKKLENFYHFWL